MPTTMTGGDAIAKSLRAHGVQTVFGLPGAQVYGLFDAFHRHDFRVVTPRHEQACGYMAFGAARATGRPAAYAVVPGPGVLNTTAAMLTAAGCCEQVLCITGEVPTPFIGKGRGHLHEMRDQRATLATIAKEALHIATPAEAPQAVARAFQTMCSHRPGPVAIQMPWEQFIAEEECAPAAPLAPMSDPQPGEALERAAALLSRAEAPMIFVGAGAYEASEEVRQLAERLGAPVMAFRSGRGIVSNRHPLGLTIAEARRLWPDVDCALGIGSRLEVMGWRWHQRPEVPIIRIDIDAAALAGTPQALGLHGRASTTVAALLDMPALRRASEKPAWAARIARAREQVEQEIRNVTPHHEYLRAIRAVLPDDGILADEVCQAGFAACFSFPVYKPRTFLSSGHQGTLGAGYGTALGAKVALPDTPVVSINGDGGFMFGMQELATAAQYGIGVVAIVYNNNAFFNVQRDQIERFEGRTIGARLQNPDFLRLAAAFDIPAARVSAPEDLRKELDRALSHGGAHLIEIPVRDEQTPWKFLRA